MMARNAMAGIHDILPNCAGCAAGGPQARREEGTRCGGQVNAPLSAEFAAKAVDHQVNSGVVSVNGRAACSYLCIPSQSQWMGQISIGCSNCWIQTSGSDSRPGLGIVTNSSTSVAAHKGQLASVSAGLPTYRSNIQIELYSNTFTSILIPVKNCTVWHPRNTVHKKL